MTPPVEMTKGRAALPLSGLLNRARFASPWVGRRPMTPPVEMTKGRAALPLSVVAEQDPFFIALGGPKAHDSSGRDDKGESWRFQQQWLLNRTRSSSPWVGRRPMTPPVEMTKGRAALPLSVVAERDPLFIGLGGPKAHDSSGRDDKGEGGASRESSC